MCYFARALFRVRNTTPQGNDNQNLGEVVDTSVVGIFKTKLGNYLIYKKSVKYFRNG